MKAPFARRVLMGTNTKIRKSDGTGYVTRALSLAPAKLGGVGEMCPWRTDQCTDLCINGSGLAEVYASIEKARIAKTQFMVREPDAFRFNLCADLTALEKTADAESAFPAARLNCFSDLRWELRGIMNLYPRTQFYDYTKAPSEARPRLPKNYHLTYSFTGEQISVERSKAWRKRGVNTAVVFRVRKGRPLPKRFLGRPVIDGDLTDLRFLDRKGVFVGLRLKGQEAKKGGESAFVVEVDPVTNRAIEYKWTDTAPAPMGGLTFNAKGVAL